MTTYTVGYRNVSDMCNFLIVWGLDWLVPSQLRDSGFFFSQGAAAELLCSIPSLVTMCRYSCYMWLHHAQARVTKCLQGTPSACRPRAPSSLWVTNICFWCFPCTFFLHLVAFAVQNTDHFSIFINLSRGAKAKLLGAWDAESWFGMFSHAWETGEHGFSFLLFFLHCWEFCSVSEKACPAMKELI